MTRWRRWPSYPAWRWHRIPRLRKRLWALFGRQHVSEYEWHRAVIRVLRGMS